MPENQTTPENPAPAKRRRGPQTKSVTEMRAFNQIVAALQSVEEADRMRVLKSACSMVQLDLTTGKAIALPRPQDLS